MYAVVVTVRNTRAETDHSRESMTVYGPYKTEDRAADVRFALGEQALSAPGHVDVSICVLPLVRHGLSDLIESVAKSAT